MKKILLICLVLFSTLGSFAYADTPLPTWNEIIAANAPAKPAATWLDKFAPHKKKKAAPVRRLLTGATPTFYGHLVDASVPGCNGASCAVTNANNNFSVAQSISGSTGALTLPTTGAQILLGSAGVIYDNGGTIQFANHGLTANNAQFLDTGGMVIQRGNIAVSSGNVSASNGFTAGSSTYGPTSATVNGTIITSTYNGGAAVGSASFSTDGGAGTAANGLFRLNANGGFIFQNTASNANVALLGSGGITSYGTNGFLAGSSTYGPTSATVNGGVSVGANAFGTSGSINFVNNTASAGRNAGEPWIGQDGGATQGVAINLPTGSTNGLRVSVNNGTSFPLTLTPTGNLSVTGTITSNNGLAQPPTVNLDGTASSSTNKYAFSGSSGQLFTLSASCASLAICSLTSSTMTIGAGNPLQCVVTPFGSGVAASITGLAAGAATLELRNITGSSIASGSTFRVFAACLIN